MKTFQLIKAPFNKNTVSAVTLNNNYNLDLKNPDNFDDSDNKDDMAVADPSLFFYDSKQDNGSDLSYKDIENICFIIFAVKNLACELEKNHNPDVEIIEKNIKATVALQNNIEIRSKQL